MPITLGRETPIGTHDIVAEGTEEVKALMTALGVLSRQEGQGEKEYLTLIVGPESLEVRGSVDVVARLVGSTSFPVVKST